MRRSAALLLAAVVLADCSSKPTPTPTATAVSLAPSVTAAPVAVVPPAPVASAVDPTPPATFPDADDVIAFLFKVGLDCGPQDRIDDPSQALSLIDCGSSIVVGVYASHKKAAAQFDLLARTVLPETGVHIAIGSNWTVSSDDPSYAQAAARKLGGVYRTT